MFSTYFPTDYKDGGVEEEVERQSFYNLLFACLKQVPASDKLVVLGDFNVELGSNWEDQGRVVGRFHVNRGALEPSHNGAYLIDLAAAFNFRIANTFFKHRLGHLAIWRHEATKRSYVKDYILVSGSAMRGVTDYRVYASV